MRRFNEQRNKIYEDISRYRNIMNYITEQQQGEVNYTIQQLQQLLNSKGYNVGKDDGVLGNNTLNGILKALGTSNVTAQPANVTNMPQVKRDYTQNTSTTNNSTFQGSSANPTSVPKVGDGAGTDSKEKVNLGSTGAPAAFTVGKPRDWTKR